MSQLTPKQFIPMYQPQKFNFERLKEELADIDIKKPEIWSSQVWMVAWTITALSSAILAYVVMVMPINKSIEREANTRKDLLQKYRQNHSALSALEKSDDQTRQLNLQFNTQLKQLPKDTEVADLLQGISQSALASGLKLSNLALTPEIDQSIFTAQPIIMNARGGFHQFGQFVDHIANLPRIVTIEDFKASTVETANNSSIVSYTIKANTYRYLKGSPVATDSTLPADPAINQVVTP